MSVHLYIYFNFLTEKIKDNKFYIKHKLRFLYY